MAIVFQCSCGRPLRAQDGSAGKRTKCPHCGEVMTIPGPASPGATKPGTGDSQIPVTREHELFATTREHDPLSLDLDWSTLGGAKPSRSGSGIVNVEPTTSSYAIPAVSAPEDPSPDGGRYKVLTLKDQGFSGKFSAPKLEEQLNHAARNGWSVKSAVSLTIPGGHGASHEELIIILERDAASSD